MGPLSVGEFEKDFKKIKELLAIMSANILKQTLVKVLEALMSADNMTRKSAETFFSDSLRTDSQGIVQCLLSIISDKSCDSLYRSFAGVLLRRAIEKCQFSPEMTSELRLQLVQLWQCETDPTLVKRLSHIISQSAMNSSWPDLLPCVINNVSVRYYVFCSSYSHLMSSVLKSLK